jgi:hypothetical protein
MQNSVSSVLISSLKAEFFDYGLRIKEKILSFLIFHQNFIQSYGTVACAGHNRHP